MDQRGSDIPSIDNFGLIILFSSSAIDGISSYFDTVAASMSSMGGGLPRILQELSPIPSFVYYSSYDSNLSSIINGQTSGSSRPMPFLGEVYFNIGWIGLAIAYMQGAISAVVNLKVGSGIPKDRVWWLLMYVTLIYSFMYMPHSGLRASTRPFVWVFMFFVARKFALIFLPTRRRKIGNV